MKETKRIFISNRLPYSVNEQTSEVKRGSGGLVSALLDVNLDEPFLWLGFESSQKSIELINEHAKNNSEKLIPKPIYIDSKLYDLYYNKFSNDVLWPLFHYEGRHTKFTNESWLAYKEANTLMAESVSKIANPNDTVWIHDFHFFLLPEILKKLRPDLKIGFFLHIPFPSSEIFRQLPIREELLRGICGCDLIGFQEHSYLRHFTVCLGAFLGVDSTFFKVDLGSHTLHLGVYPISIDTLNFKKKAQSFEVEDRTEKLKKKIQSNFLILGVDRLDYIKGVELKLKGFYRALQKYPELIGKANLMQIAIPTRAKVPAYSSLKREVEQLVGQINGEFGKPDYTPVMYIYNSVSEKDLLALYRRAECLLITSKRDGMNLVAMEYVMSQNLNSPGTLILSEFTGAASLLGSAQIINPWNEEAIADAIYNGFSMPLLKKRKVLSDLQYFLSQYSASQWANSFLKDLKSYTTQKTQQSSKLIYANRNSWDDDFQKLLFQRKLEYLFLDFDGTLVPLQSLPHQAQISSDVLEILTKINNHVKVAIISGRPKKFLDKQFKDQPFLLAAEHGVFFRSNKERWKSRVTSDLKTWYHEVENVMSDYSRRVPLSFVEKKEASIAWHYRESPSGFANYQAKRLLDELQISMANLPVSFMAGSKIIEARSIECNKGNFIRWQLSNSSLNQENYLIMALGDDKTDEDMFKALNQTNGISIKIGMEDTMAKFRISSQHQVFHFLKELYHYIKRE